MNINILYFTVSTLLFTSCSAQNSRVSKINTKINKEFISSRKSFIGKLNSEEYKEIRKEILKVLKAEIPENNAILINYYQYGTNCYEYGLKEKDALSVIENSKSISSRISKENNTDRAVNCRKKDLPDESREILFI